MAALAGDQPQVAGVAQPGPVGGQGLLGLLGRLHEHDRGVQLAGPDQAAPDRLLDVARAAPGPRRRPPRPAAGASCPASGRCCGGCSRAPGPSDAALHSTRQVALSYGADSPEERGADMGFMDKAKKLADQAQQKIDETQKSFNENQQQKAARRPARSRCSTTTTAARSPRRASPLRRAARAALDPADAGHRAGPARRDAARHAGGARRPARHPPAPQPASPQPPRSRCRRGAAAAGAGREQPNAGPVQADSIGLAPLT